MIIVADRGNELIDIIDVSEENADKEYAPINHCGHNGKNREAKGHFSHTTLDKYFNGEEGELDQEEMKAGWHIYFPDDKVWFNIYLAEFEGHRALYIDNQRYFASDTWDIGCERMDVSPLFNWIIAEEKKFTKGIPKKTFA